MKKKPLVTVCPLCKVECRGDGFLATPIKQSFVMVAVMQCPKCMRLVSMHDDRYLDAHQREFMARINGASEELAA